MPFPKTKQIRKRDFSSSSSSMSPVRKPEAKISRIKNDNDSPGGVSENFRVTTTPISKKSFSISPDLRRSSPSKSPFSDQNKDYKTFRNESFASNSTRNSKLNHQNKNLNSDYRGKFDKGRNFRNYEDRRRNSPPRRFNARRMGEREGNWKRQGREERGRERSPLNQRNGQRYQRERSNERTKRDSDEETSNRDSLMSYKEFLLKQRDDITPEEALRLYDQYKKEFRFSHTKIFFERHKDEEWFLEKYNPVNRVEMLKKQLEISRNDSKSFFEELQSLQDETTRKEKLERFIKKYDLERDLNAFEFINATEKEIKIENESERMVELERRLYDERQRTEKFPGSESDSDSSHSETKKSNLSDLGRVIALRTSVKDSREQTQFDENSVFISTIPLKVSRADLQQVFEKIKGFVKMCISEPIPKYSMNRFVWVTFNSQEACLKALELNGHKINYSNDYPPLYLHVLPKRKSSKTIRPAHFYTLLNRRVEIDISQCLKLCSTLNKRKGFEEVFDEKILAPFNSLPKLVTLNLLMAYLRIAHYFCYYCGIDYATEEGLMSRCTKSHPRNTIVNVENERNFRFPRDDNDEISANEFHKWTNSLDERIIECLEKDENKEIMEWEEEKRKDFCERNMEKDKKPRVRCRLCDKVFMSRQYLQKHLALRHKPIMMEFMENQKQETFFKNYELDSNRFLLENVEAVIPGDVTAFETPNGPRRIFNTNGSQPQVTRQNTGEKMRGFRQSSFIRRGRPTRRREYFDWDKPVDDAEEEIDYGLASETTSIFRL